MNILFLDIDEVLNNELFYEKRANSSSSQAFQNESNLVGENHNKNFYQRHIDFELTRELYSFCIENDAKIVVSSTWRKSKTVEELKEIFESICTGMREIIIDKIPNSDHGIRGVEILQWLKQNKSLNIQEHVIFDDDSDFLIWQARNFIKINAYCGITPCDFYKAKRIFSKEDLNYY